MAIGLRDNSPIHAFTMLEVVVMVAILTLLVGLLAPTAKNMIKDAAAAKITDKISLLTEACQRYHVDVGAYAIEKSGTPETPNWDPKDHKLSMTPPNSIAGWNGPYLSDPISLDDHPYGGTIEILNVLSRNTEFPGFDFNATGEFRGGDGNCLWLSEVPAAVARKIDEALDPDTNHSWMEKGRVVYRVVANGRGSVYIYLYTTDLTVTSGGG